MRPDLNPTIQFAFYVNNRGTVKVVLAENPQEALMGVSYKSVKSNLKGWNFRFSHLSCRKPSSFPSTYLISKCTSRKPPGNLNIL